MKKKLLYLSDSAFVNTGFGQVSYRLLKSLQKTEKYEILHVCGGIMQNDPNCQRPPWKSIGAIPQDQNVVNKMNSDQGFARYVSYGGEMIEPAVLNFKPDVVMVVQDPWGASNFCSQKYFWNKTNCIAWETFDSLPLLTTSIEQISKLKHLYCWSTFAEKEFHRLGHTHVKTQFPPIDTNNYFPVSKQDKEKLKQYFGISDKKFIINYVFRNQLRKQSWTLVEAYGLLTQKHPEIAKNIWIHFHTSVSEGWDHKRFCKQYNVDYNRILYTWICKNCKELQIKADNGDKNCPHCNSKDSQETCSVGFGATVEQMNWIYNISNCSTILANSGATEIPAIEALSAGVPLATVNYSYGEDFCQQSFVFTLESSKYIEYGTQFIKVSPHANSIAKFIRNIYNSMPIEIEKLSRAGRKWIVDNFETEIVSKKWQEVIDNMPKVDWDFTIKPDIKNPNAEIDFNIEDDYEYIFSCYEKVLNMWDMRDKSKNEIIHWYNFLKQPGNKRQLREQLVQNFKQVGVQKNAEQQKISLEDLLDKTDKSRVLLIIKESAGDCYIISSLLPEIRAKYPDSSIYIACDQKFWEIFDLNEYVKRCLPWTQDIENELVMTGVGNHKGYFNYFHNIGLTTQRSLNYLSSTY